MSTRVSISTRLVRGVKRRLSEGEPVGLAPDMFPRCTELLLCIFFKKIRGIAPVDISIPAGDDARRSQKKKSTIEQELAQRASSVGSPGCQDDGRGVVLLEEDQLTT